MKYSKISVFTLSSLIYIFGFIYLNASNPSLFEKETTQEQCFFMFFLSGVSATIIYHIVLSLYSS